MSKELIIVAYSGHGLVVTDIAIDNGWKILAYCDKEEKGLNPHKLKYLGNEMDPSIRDVVLENEIFLAIGHNRTRYNVEDDLNRTLGKSSISLIHSSAIVSPTAIISKLGVAIMPGVVINSASTIDRGVICNSSSIIEHECHIKQYAHIAPGATLAGNVTIGERSFIGANSVVKQGVKIGDDVIIGAGTVILHDIPNGATFVGNPGKEK